MRPANPSATYVAPIWVRGFLQKIHYAKNNHQGCFDRMVFVPLDEMNRKDVFDLMGFILGVVSREDILVM